MRRLDGERRLKLKTYLKKGQIFQTFGTFPKDFS